MSGQLPAAIVSGGGDTCSFWKWKDFQMSRARDLDLDLGSSHTAIAYRRASLIDLYLPAKFHWNRRNVFNGRTYTRTDWPCQIQSHV